MPLRHRNSWLGSERTAPKAWPGCCWPSSSSSTTAAGACLAVKSFAESWEGQSWESTNNSVEWGGQSREKRSPGAPWSKAGATWLCNPAYAHPAWGNFQSTALVTAGKERGPGAPSIPRQGSYGQRPNLEKELIIRFFGRTWTIRILKD